MKKLIYILLIVVSLFGFNSCTENTRAKEFGGEMTITLPKGEKLIEATWKDDNIWYLTEPMDSSYKPTTKTLHEDSRYGLMKGTVHFIESK